VWGLDVFFHARINNSSINIFLAATFEIIRKLISQKEVKMAQQPLVNRILTLVKHPQFTWWIGHCVVLFCSFFYFYYWITFRNAERTSYYYTAYLGAMLSYGVVVYKTFGTPHPSWKYFQKIHKDENVFYLGLSVLWFLNAPVIVTLLPYATFSLFHSITYFRTNILPTFFPPSHQPYSGSQSSSTSSPYEQWANNMSRFIMTWVQRHYDQAMRTVSFFEVVVITLMLIWNILMFRLSFYTLIIYFFFLRMRYHMNQFSRQAFIELGQFLDGWLVPPSASANIPSYVTKAYLQAKSAVIWAGSFNPQRR
ncbi:5249_t:CDS:2, partial [Acaulospora morrowiae]